MLRVQQRYTEPVSHSFYANMAAAFQMSVVDVLVEDCTCSEGTRCQRGAIVRWRIGSAALREAMRSEVAVPVYTLRRILCTDNAAMIAAAGYFRFQAGERAGWDLDIEPGLQLA